MAGGTKFKLLLNILPMVSLVNATTSNERGLGLGVYTKVTELGIWLRS